MNTATAEKQTDSAAKPQFFENPQPLDMKRHASAGLCKAIDASFARKCNAMAITLREVPEASRSYPIVFSNSGTPKLLAILGAERHNAFIEEDGKWRANHYVPAYVRHYPFGVAHTTDNTFILCVDESADNYMGENPELPFYDGDQPSEMCTQALKLCASYQHQLEETEKFCVAVKEAGLLDERQVQLATPAGESHALGGFSLINEERWNEFARGNISAWQEKGYVAPMVLAMAAQHNWKHLG